MPYWPAEMFVTWAWQEKGLSFPHLLFSPLPDDELKQPVSPSSCDWIVRGWWAPGQTQGRRSQGALWWMLIPTMDSDLPANDSEDLEGWRKWRQQAQLRSKWRSFSRPFQSPLVLRAPSQHPQVRSAVHSSRVNIPSGFGRCVIPDLSLLPILSHCPLAPSKLLWQWSYKHFPLSALPVVI